MYACGCIHLGVTALCPHVLWLCLRTSLVSVPRQAGRRLEALYSEKGGVPVLFTSPYYVQLMDEVRTKRWGGSCLSQESCISCVPIMDPRWSRVVYARLLRLWLKPHGCKHAKDLC